MLGSLPDDPFVSVFGLTYNHEDYVAEAIESVLASGWPSRRLEYVLLDDGSTDATPERVKPYLRHITYIRQENQGINASVNRVLAMLRGDVIASCGGDDAWPPGKLERTVGQLQEHPELGFVYGDLEAIDRRGRVLAPSLMKASNVSPQRGQIAGRLLAGNFVNGGTMTIRGAFKNELVPIPPVAAWEDWWFAWVLSNLAPVDYVDAIVYRYRRHGANYVFGLDDADKVLDRQAREIPFRRYLLGNVRPGTCSLVDLLGAADALRRLLRGLSAHGRPTESVLDVTPSERAAAQRLAEQSERVAPGSPVVGAFTAARALAADPGNEAAYRVLHSVAGTPRVSLPPFFDDVRAVTIFADLEELVSEPALLAAYAETFGAEDDVTLVAVARTWDGARLAAELAPFERLLASDDAPDMIAAPADQRAWLNGLTRADGVLGLRDVPVPGLRRFTEAGELREYVERRWRFPVAS